MSPSLASGQAWQHFHISVLPPQHKNKATPEGGANTWMGEGEVGVVVRDLGEDSVSLVTTQRAESVF